MSSAAVLAPNATEFVVCEATLDNPARVDVNGDVDAPDYVECTFSGDVEVVVEFGRVTWVCPSCGTEHDEDRSF